MNERMRWWQHALSIMLLLVIYGSVMCMIVWMMISYPIDH